MTEGHVVIIIPFWEPLAQTHHLDEDRQGYTNFALQFYKAVIGYSIGEIFLHMLLNVKDIETFQVFECPSVEQDLDSHYFALGHRKFAVPLPCVCIMQRVIPDEHIKFFEKFVNNKIKICSFTVGNYSEIISNLLLFSDLKILNFPLYSYYLSTFLISDPR